MKKRKIILMLAASMLLGTMGCAQDPDMKNRETATAAITEKEENTTETAAITTTEMPKESDDDEETPEETAEIPVEDTAEEETTEAETEKATMDPETEKQKEIELMKLAYEALSDLTSNSNVFRFFETKASFAPFMLHTTDSGTKLYRYENGEAVLSDLPEEYNAYNSDLYYFSGSDNYVLISGYAAQGSEYYANVYDTDFQCIGAYSVSAYDNIKFEGTDIVATNRLKICYRDEKKDMTVTQDEVRNILENSVSGPVVMIPHIGFEEENSFSEAYAAFENGSGAAEEWKGWTKEMYFPYDVVSAAIDAYNDQLRKEFGEAIEEINSVMYHINDDNIPELVVYAPGLGNVFYEYIPEEDEVAVMLYASSHENVTEIKEYKNIVVIDTYMYSTEGTTLYRMSDDHRSLLALGSRNVEMLSDPTNGVPEYSEPVYDGLTEEEFNYFLGL